MNQSILLFFNGFVGQSAALDGLGKFLIQGGLFLVALVLLAVYILGFARKQLRWRAAAIETGVFAVACLLIGFVIGQIVREPRPLFALAPEVKVLLTHGNDSSFPSDHMLVCFSVAFGLYALNKKLGVSLMVFGLLVGFAKMFAAQHYPLDIAGTILLVLALFLLYRAFVTKWVAKTYLALEHRVLPSLSQEQS